MLFRSLEDILEEPEDAAPTTFALPAATHPTALDLPAQPVVANAFSQSSLAKRSPPVPGQLQMPPGLQGMSQKDVRRKFNGFKIMVILSLNNDLIKCVLSTPGRAGSSSGADADCGVWCVQDRWRDAESTTSGPSRICSVSPNAGAKCGRAPGPSLTFCATLRLTDRLRANLTYLGAMAQQFEQRDNVSFWAI